MAHVDVVINGRSYRMACEDGQEAHLARLGEEIDRRVRGLAGTIGPVDDLRLLVMVSLILADELSEAAAAVDAAADRIERIAARLEERPAG